MVTKMRGSDFLDTLDEKKEMELIKARANQQIQDHLDFTATTKCEDSKRNSETTLNKSRTGYKERRKEYTLWSPYNELKISKKGKVYRLSQITEGRVKRFGNVFKAVPVDSVGDSFEIAETALKIQIKREYIHLVKETK